MYGKTFGAIKPEQLTNEVRRSAASLQLPCAPPCRVQQVPGPPEGPVAAAAAFAWRSRRVAARAPPAAGSRRLTSARVRTLHAREQVWDHLFLGKPVPEGCTIAADHLALMRREFEFWYPFDLRVSGKVGRALRHCGLCPASCVRLGAL